MKDDFENVYEMIEHAIEYAFEGKMQLKFYEFLNSIQPALISLLEAFPHYFYCDIHMNNVISLDNNKFGLIDLTSFIPISQGNREDILANVRKHLTEYGDEILNLLPHHPLT